MKRILILISILTISLSIQTALADDFDDLGELSDDMSTTSQDLSNVGDSSSEISTSGANSKLSVNFGGYLKAVGYWNEERYSDALWEEYYAYYALKGNQIPASQELNGINNLGTRMQLQLEAFLEDKARLYTAFNVNFNAAHSIHDSSGDSSSSETGSIRLVESYVEIYQGNTTFKIGSQLVTWGYMEGIEVPTDRVNARDYSYKSTEYEDSKLPSTGILLNQRMWDSYLDILFIPIAQVNTKMEFQDYFYPKESAVIENKPNNGKLATRFSSALGNLDFAVSYVEGLDPVPDLIPSALDPIGIDPETGMPLFTILPTGKQYNRVKSSGLDLQYNFSSVLAKASYVSYQTEDEEGEDIYIKNNWSKYLVGAEFKIGASTINLYAGQQLIENYQDDFTSTQTNFLLGQLRERTDFVSGHINANFLTGDALNLVLLAAGYWNEDGEPVQSNVKATMKYKIANGLELAFSPSYMELLENVFVDYQFEVKYSF